MPRTLAAKQRAFIAYYLGEARMNATKAARMAGYRSPRVEGCRLLTNADIRAEIEAVLSELRAEGILAKHNRLRDYDELRRRLWQVIEERAAEHEERSSAYPAGGRSGLVVRQVKVVGTGRNQRVIEEFLVDTDLVAQLLAVNRQAAQELGEWSEKKQISGPHDGPIEIAAAESAAERLLALLAEADAGAGPAAADQEARS